MLRGCLTIFLVLAGLFASGIAFESAAACSREGMIGGYAMVAGALALGAAALLIARRRNWAPWVSWAVAVTTALAASFGVSIAALWVWVGECSN